MGLNDTLSKNLEENYGSYTYILTYQFIDKQKLYEKEIQSYTA